MDGQIDKDSQVKLQIDRQIETTHRRYIERLTDKTYKHTDKQKGRYINIRQIDRKVNTQKDRQRHKYIERQKHRLIYA